MKEDPLAHLENKPGIYMIINRVTGERYIGQSIDIKKRCRTHRQKLDGRWQINGRLMEASQLHGREAFDFTVLEYVETIPTPEGDNGYIKWRELMKRMLDRREDHYVRTLRPEYNIDTIPLEDGVIISARIERVVVDAIEHAGWRPTDFIREAVLEKLRAMSLLDS